MKVEEFHFYYLMEKFKLKISAKAPKMPKLPPGPDAEKLEKERQAEAKLENATGDVEKKIVAATEEAAGAQDKEGGQEAATAARE